MNSDNIISAYTDGSCNTKYKIGAWAAIMFIDNNRIVLNETNETTTNNRMELMAVLGVFDYIKNNNIISSKINIHTDSQYVANIEKRLLKLKIQNYKTKKGEPIRNSDLVKQLIYYIENMNIEFIKVKAHQKKTETENYNRFVDKLSRKLVRTYVAKKL